MFCISLSKKMQIFQIIAAKNSHFLVKKIQIPSNKSQILLNTKILSTFTYESDNKTSRNIQIQLYLITSKSSLLIKSIQIQFQFLRKGLNDFQIPIQKCPDRNAKIYFSINVLSMYSKNKNNLWNNLQSNQYQQNLIDFNKIQKSKQNNLMPIPVSSDKKKNFMVSLSTSQSINDKNLNLIKIKQQQKIKKPYFLQMNQVKRPKQFKKSQAFYQYYPTIEYFQSDYEGFQKQNINTDEYLDNLINENKRKTIRSQRKLFQSRNNEPSRYNNRDLRTSIQKYIANEKDSNRNSPKYNNPIDKLPNYFSSIPTWFSRQTAQFDQKHYKNEIRIKQRQIQRLSNRNKTLQTKLSTQKQVNKSIKNDLKNYQSKIKQKQRIIKNQYNKKEHLRQQFQKNQQFYRTKIQKIKQINLQNEKIIKQKKIKYEQDIKSIQEDYKEKINKIQREYKQLIRNEKIVNQKLRQEYEKKVLDIVDKMNFTEKENQENQNIIKSNQQLIKSKQTIIKSLQQKIQNYQNQITNLKLQKINSQKNLQNMSASQIQALRNQIHSYKNQNEKLLKYQSELIRKIQQLEIQLKKKCTEIEEREIKITQLQANEQMIKNQINNLKALIKIKQGEIFQAGLQNLKKDDLFEQYLQDNENIKKQLQYLKSECDILKKSNNLTQSIQNKKFMQLDIEKNIKFNLEQLQELDRLEAQNKRLILENKQLYKLARGMRQQQSESQLQTPAFRSVRRNDYSNHNSNSKSKEMIDQSKQQSTQNKITEQQTKQIQKPAPKRKLLRKKRLDVDFETSNQIQRNTQISDSV